MTLFSETPEDGSPALISPREIAELERARKRRSRGWLALSLSFVILLGLALWPAPYAVQQPGPVFNTLGTVTIDDEEVPMIEISGADTYDTDGQLDMLTVQAIGNREQRPNWYEIATAWFDSSRQVVPIDSLYPPGVTQEQRDAENQALMVDSQQEAIAVALSELGYDFPAQFSVGQVADGSPADGELKIDDELIAVNGNPVSDLTSLREQIEANGADKPAAFEISRGGVPMTVSITPTTVTASDGSDVAIVGIGTKMVYDFPIDVTIQLDNVGGPSAGMMFALGIIDILTPGQLNGGENVAGTGTIDAEGTVGAIGGIRQKLYGALSAGASYFLAPASNCGEVVGHVPDGLRVFSVSTIDDSLAALKAISSGTGLDDLRSCEDTVAAG